MSTTTYVLLSSSLTFGVPLILAVRELFVLRHDSAPGWRGPDEPPQAPPPPSQGPASIRKPLPDCLIPKPLARLPELVD